MSVHMNTSGQQTISRAEVTNAFLRSVYNWMAVGLSITAAISWIITGTSLSDLIRTPAGMVTMIVCILLELGLVFYLSARINTFSASKASALFLIYSALNGVTLSIIIASYTTASVTTAFLTTTGMFAAISLYGMTTKRDLASVGSFCMMGLFGIIIASVVNIFINSSAFQFGISCIGVLVFVGLTAYDTQYLKEMGESVPQNDALAVRRGVILGALKLYLDFINLFIMLLRILGDRR